MIKTVLTGGIAVVCSPDTEVRCCRVLWSKVGWKVISMADLFINQIIDKLDCWPHNDVRPYLK